jgi:hypothetical protein
MPDSHQSTLGGHPTGTDTTTASTVGEAVVPRPDPPASSREQTLPVASSLPVTDRETARRPAYIAFTHRIPFALSAYRLGFAPGFSEEYRFRSPGPNCQMPAIFLDNNFRDPDLDRWLSLFETTQPKIGVLGDADTRAEARRYVTVAEQLRDAYPGFEPVVVPKCDCFDLIPDDIIIGFAEGAAVADGKAATHPLDFSEYADWRGRRVHILGGTPPRQYKVIEALTHETQFTNSLPADIVGCDYNGFYPAGHGAYWTRDGWVSPNEELGTKYCRQYWVDQGYIQPAPGRDAHEYSLLEKVHIGLHEAKRFWRERDLWPTTHPRDVYGPAVHAPTDDQLADGTPVAYTERELQAGHLRTVDDKKGVAGDDRIETTLADGDTVAGGTLAPSDRAPQPVTVVDDHDHTVRAHRTPLVSALPERRQGGDLVVGCDTPATGVRPGLRNPPATVPSIDVPDGPD